MLYLSTSQCALICVFAFVLGACLASFIDCAVSRRSSGKSVLWGRSECPSCGQVLGATELIPVVSWLMQHGRCKHCGAALSLRYPVVELVGGVSFAVLVWVHGRVFGGLSLVTLEYAMLICILLYASLVDIQTRIIPNACVVAALLLHVVYIVVAGPVLGIIDTVAALQFSLIGAFAVGIPMLVLVLIADRIFGRESMGGGDLKLFFVTGFYFGWEQCLFLIVLACLFGIGAGLVGHYRDRKDQTGKQDMSEQVSGEQVLGEQTLSEQTTTEQASEQARGLRGRSIAFGPAIAAACFTIMLIGPQLVWWYKGFL